MISSTVAFASAGVPRPCGADARRYAVAGVPPVVRPVAFLTQGTGVPAARLRALALEVGRITSGMPGVLPTPPATGFAPRTDQPTNDATPLGIHSPGRPSS